MDPQSEPLEQLLDKLASDEVPADVRHRYALRRALLNSTQFESNAAAQAVWGQWMAATGTVLAGSAAVVVFVVSVRIADIAAVRNASVQTAVAERSLAESPATVAAAERPSVAPRVSLAQMRQDIPMDRLWNSFQTQMLATSR